MINIKIVKVFNRQSPERIARGCYRINIRGKYVSFMSLIAFKAKHRILNNTDQQNKTEATRLNLQYGESAYKCLTEHKKSREVYLFPIFQLEEFFNIRSMLGYVD